MHQLTWDQRAHGSGVADDAEGAVRFALRAWYAEGQKAPEHICHRALGRGKHPQAVLDEYVFQLRSRQPRGTITNAQLQDIADTIRRSLSLTSATLWAKDPKEDDRGLAMGTRFAVRYGGGRTENGGALRMSDVRTAFNSAFWPFVLTSTSVDRKD